MNLSTLQIWFSDISKLTTCHPSPTRPCPAIEALQCPWNSQAPSHLRAFLGANFYASNTFAQIPPWLTSLSSLTTLDAIPSVNSTWTTWNQIMNLTSNTLEPSFLWKLGFTGGSDHKRICLHCGRHGFDPWVGKILWRRDRLPTLAFWLGEFHGQRSPAGYGPWSCKESDLTPSTLDPPF